MRGFLNGKYCGLSANEVKEACMRCFLRRILYFKSNALQTVQKRYALFGNEIRFGTTDKQSQRTAHLFRLFYRRSL